MVIRINTLVYKNLWYTTTRNSYRLDPIMYVRTPDSDPFRVVASKRRLGKHKLQDQHHKKYSKQPSKHKKPKRGRKRERDSTSSSEESEGEWHQQHRARQQPKHKKPKRRRKRERDSTSSSEQS